jgi:hypothetical protein
MSPDQPPRSTEGERAAAVERLKEAFAEGHGVRAADNQAQSTLTKTITL